MCCDFPVAHWDRRLSCRLLRRDEEEEALPFPSTPPESAARIPPLLFGDKKVAACPAARKSPFPSFAKRKRGNRWCGCPFSALGPLGTVTGPGPPEGW